MSTKINKKEVEKGKKVETKKDVKNVKKVETKKVMKRETTKETPNFGPIRKIFNSVLGKNKGLTLVENKHGAVQIKNDSGLLFSARSNGKMIITHPIFKGKGKTAERIHKHPGSKWDHLSEVPLDEITESMLTARIADKKTASDYHNEFYAGKNKENSGLFIKAEAAKARAGKAEKASSKRTKKADETLKAAKMAKTKVSKKGQKAITKIRKPAVAEATA